MDSNHEKRLQRALCYHYTIGQTGIDISFFTPLCKTKIIVRLNAIAKKVCPRNDSLPTQSTMICHE